MAESIGHWDNSDKPIISPHKWRGDSHLDVTLEAIREMFRQEIQLVRETSQLEPEAPRYPLITKSHIGVEVEFTDFGGQKYRGVLYPTKED